MAFIPLNLGNFNTSKEPLSTSLTKINDMIEELYTFSEEGDLGSISQNIVPDQDNLRDLGSADKKWRSLYVSGNTIYLGNSIISVDNQGNLSVNGASIAATTWENVTGRPEIPTSIFNLDVPQSIIRPGFLKYDGSDLNWIELSSVAESGSYNSLTDKPTLITSYNDLSNKPDLSVYQLSSSAFSGSYTDLSNKPSSILDFNLSDGNAGDVLSTDGDGGLSFQPVESLKQRSMIGTQTNSLSPDQAGVLQLYGYKTYALLKVSVDNAAWVRIYSSQAALTADATRLITEDADPGIGLIAEILTSGNQTINMAPSPIGFNDDDPIAETIWISVVNKSAESAVIEVIVTVLQLEK